MKVIIALLLLALVVILQAQPTAPPCKVDIAVAVDISGSMGDDATALCSVEANLAAALAPSGIDLKIQLYTIARPQVPPGCASLNNNGLLNFATGNNVFDPLCYFAPAGSDIGGDIESWGFGMELACRFHPWRAGALKLVLAASDEAPCTGNTIGAPPNSPLNCDADDTTAANRAITALNTYGCHGSVVIPADSQTNVVPQCVVDLANLIATGTGGDVFRYDSSSAVLTPQLVAAVTAVTNSICRKPPADCDETGSVGLDPSCASSCLCYSGYGDSTLTGRCATKQTGCRYEGYDNLYSKKEHVAAIDQVRTRFDNGHIKIVVSGGAVELTNDNSRLSYISVGLESFNRTNWPDPCHCFVQSTACIGGLASDVWTNDNSWDDIRPCCQRTFDPFYVTYDCTLDVVHVDGLVFEGDWREVPTRGRWHRFPLPLIIKFQRQINTTSEITVFTDVDIKAYISFQQYFQSLNQGYLQVDVVTLWPYQLTLNNWYADDTDRFTNIQVSFTSVASAPFNSDNTGRGCTLADGSKCWQTLSIFLRPRNSSVCNLDNRFVFNFTVSCRTAACPDLTHSQVNTTIQAIFRTENFCPAVTFVFPLNATLTPWVPGFIRRERNFIIYRYIIGGTALNPAIAQKVCLLAEVNVDNVRATENGVIVPQGYTGQDIRDVYFRNLRLLHNGVPIVLYDDTQSPAICPGFTSECNTANQIALVIDILGNSNNFPSLQPNQAGACFFLTRNDGHLNQPVAPPRGLVDPWGLSIEAIYNIPIEALLQVVFEDEKRNTELGEATATGEITTGDDSESSAGTVVYSMALIIAAILALFF